MYAEAPASASGRRGTFDLHFVALLKISVTHGGNKMPEHPLQVFVKNDSELIELIKKAEELELSDGVLPRKFKLLIALALDASRGAVGGVNALAKESMEAGATKEEILEVLRVVHFVCGVGSVYVAAQALNELL